MLGVSFDPRGDTPGAIGVRVCAVADGGVAAANRIAVGMTLLSVRGGGDGGAAGADGEGGGGAAAAEGTLTLELPARSGASWRGCSGGGSWGRSFCVSTDLNSQNLQNIQKLCAPSTPRIVLPVCHAIACVLQQHRERQDFCCRFGSSKPGKAWHLCL